MATRLITGRFQQWSNACKTIYSKRKTRSESSKHHDVLGREYLGVSCRCLGEEGDLACVCPASALVIQPVLLCSVFRRFVDVTGCGKHLS